MTSAAARGATILEETLAERSVYKDFWDNFSDRPDMDTMMLNTKADQLEASDRADVLASLPDFTDMDVADIGAGIGRFTSVFAAKARHVIASDFIASFIDENRRRNAHYSNISYKVGDAASLNFESGSLDLVFTNWMLMYLSDSDAIKFILDALDWLREDGYLHVRESCSEPSTGRKKSVSMHSADENPTRYRFSSVYIELFRAVRFTDANGREWRFSVHWAHSVPTYIKHQSNWRQVHWLLQKVPAPTTLDAALNVRRLPHQRNDRMAALLAKMSVEWVLEQSLWDTKLDDEHFNWTDTIFKIALNFAQVPKSTGLFCFNSRRMGFHMYINAHALAEEFAANVWCVETHAPFFRVSLTRANALKDRRVRYAWHEGLSGALEFAAGAGYRGFLSVDLLVELNAQNIEALTGVLAQDSFLITLEPVKDNDESAVEEFLQKIKLLKQHFKLKAVTEVTELADESMASYLNAHKHEHVMKPIGLRWMLMEAHL